MIVSRNWLNKFVDISNISNKELILNLDSLGLEVDSITSIKIPDKILVGLVVSCEKVEGSDKLNACKVDIGSETLDIVCGASNVAKDMKVAVAVVGCVLDNSMKIEKRKLKGLESNGMICSLGEIGINSNGCLADGILSLNGYDELKIGKALNTYDIFNDDIIDIELTANRGDCLSVIGVARELALKFDLAFDINFKNEEHKINKAYDLKIEDKSKNAHFSYCLILENELSLSFDKKLLLAFANIAYTNKIEALAFFIRHITGVNATSYAITENELLNISCEYIDNFDTLNIGNKEKSKISISKKIGKKTDEQISNLYLMEFSYIDPILANQKVFDTKTTTYEHLFYYTSRGSNNNLEMANAYLESIDEGAYRVSDIIKNNKIKKDIYINISHNYIINLIGDDIDIKKCEHILGKLAFIVELNNDNFKLKVPDFRHDIFSKQDIAEEILRVVGIDNVKASPLLVSDTKVNKDGYNHYLISKKLRQSSSIAGFCEHVSFIFSNKKDLIKYGYPTIKEDKDLLNPISGELDTLKTSNIPNLLDAVVLNKKNGFSSIALFEITSIFDEDRKQKEIISFIFSGLKELANSQNPKPENINFYEFAEKISSIIGAFDLEAINKDILDISHPHQVASIIQNNKNIGIISKVHLSTAKKLKLESTFFAEIDLSLLQKQNKLYNNICKFPTVYRDLSIVANYELEFYKIKKHIESLNIKELIKFYPCDLFKIDENNNSISVRFELQSNEKTLNEADIENIVIDNIFTSLNKNLGLELR